MPDSVLDRDDQICPGSWPPKSSQPKAQVVSEAADPQAGPRQPTTPPREVLKGRGTALLVLLDPGNAVRGDKVRQRATSRTVSEPALSPLLARWELQVPAEAEQAGISAQSGPRERD